MMRGPRGGRASERPSYTGHLSPGWALGTVERSGGIHRRCPWSGHRRGRGRGSHQVGHRCNHRDPSPLSSDAGGVWCVPGSDPSVAMSSSAWVRASFPQGLRVIGCCVGPPPPPLETAPHCPGRLGALPGTTTPRGVAPLPPGRPGPRSCYPGSASHPQAHSLLLLLRAGTAGCCLGGPATERTGEAMRGPRSPVVMTTATNAWPGGRIRAASVRRRPAYSRSFPRAPNTSPPASPAAVRRLRSACRHQWVTFTAIHV